MRKQLLLLLLCTLSAALDSRAQIAASDYVITVKTDNPGASANNQFKIPATGEYTLYYESIPAGTSGSLPAFSGVQTIAFPAAGTYRVAIKPTGATPFHQINFNNGSGNGGDAPKLLTIQQWGTTVWSSMGGAYAGCYNLTTCSTTDVPNLSNVTQMGNAFFHCTIFTGSPNMNNWVVSNVTAMGGMFTGAQAFNQPIGNWNVSNVNSIASMFWEATSFNQPIGNWDMTGKNSLSGMFYGATSFNQPLNNWNVSEATNLGGMLINAASFNQPLNNWTFNTSAPIVVQMLDGSGMDCANYSNTLIGWAANPNNPSGLNLGAQGRTYGPGAAAAHNYLTTTKGWAINDSYDPCCTFAGAGSTWTGCTSTNWATPSNWSNGAVPLATDDVIIPSAPANQPTISTAAVAKSVEVQSGAALTIAASGSLTINGSKSFTTILTATSAFFNNGTVENSGQLILGNTVSAGEMGLWNKFIFNNNAGAEVKIDRSSIWGLFNEGNFTNAAKLTMGATAAVGANCVHNKGAFNNNTGGEINFDNATNNGVRNEPGSVFSNYAKITIGAIATVGANGIDNASTFNNTGCSALINVVSNSIVSGRGTFTNSGTIIENASGNSNISSNTGIVYNLNGGTFSITTNTGVVSTSVGDNIWTGCTSTDWATASNWSKGSVPATTDDVILPGSPTRQPTIPAATAAVAKSVEVQSGDTLTIAALGSLTINGTKIISNNTTAFSNRGTVENKGRLILGNTASVGEIGLRNYATFNNHTGAEINVNNSTAIGLSNNSGGNFTNTGKIIIGNIASVGSHGLYNENSSFQNNAGAKITIDRSTQYGLRNDGGNFTNEAKIIIGAIALVGQLGIGNNDAFNNNVGGEITIDRSNLYGLSNSGTFINAAKVTIGAIASVGTTGINNQNNFQNNACAELKLFYPLNNSDSFTNAGLFTVNTALAHTNSALTNDGIIEYPQGNPIPNVTNNDLIIAPITTCATVTPALQIGGGNSFTVGTTWYTDSTLTVIAGNYTPNTFTVSNLATGTYPLYFSITDPVNNCARTVSITATIKSAPTVSIVSNNGPVCAGDTAVFMVNGTAGATLTYTLTGLPGNQMLVLNGTGQNITANSVIADVVLTLVSINDPNTCSKNLSQQDTVKVMAPATPTSPMGGIISQGQSITLTANGCSGEGFTLLWYKSADNSPVSMPVSPTVTTLYYVRCQQTLGAVSCLSDKTADVSVTVGQRIFVNAANVNPGQDGLSWSTAFASLQDGLTEARNSVFSPIEIWVAQGTYKPGTLRKEVFEIPSGVKVYGGFVGTEDSLQKRNWKTHVTILSGEIGSVQLNDNTYHVVLLRATNDTTQLDGFTIKGGYAEFFAGNQNTNLDDSDIRSSGGGILAIDKSKGLITHCTLTDNRAVGGGGILLRDSSHVRLSQSILFGNEATFGGGVYVLGGSKPTLENVLIANNKGLGGGLYVNKSQPTLVNCTIASNKDEGNNAGGIYNANAVTTVKNSILWGNSPTQSTPGSVITYSLVEAGYAGTGNKNLDPQFVSPNAVGLAPMGSLGNYHLQPCSAGIDAADNASAPLVDLEGNARPYPVGLGIADMGVYESQSSGSSGPNNLMLTENITSGTVLKTAGKITATNRVSNATVVYQATKSVTLNPGFSAMASESKSFLATIGGCP